MKNLRIVEWIGGDAPNREAALKVTPQYNGQFAAYWEPGYCGCPDCHPCFGWGDTEQEAIEDYWENWSERRADTGKEVRE